jgi:hypothetical protein
LNSRDLSSGHDASFDMVAILFTCPATGMAANAWRADCEPPDTFTPVACPACGHLHLVTAAGETMGDKRARSSDGSSSAPRAVTHDDTKSASGDVIC